MISTKTTDATIGQHLRACVEARNAEIEASITRSRLAMQDHEDLETALAEIRSLREVNDPLDEPLPLEAAGPFSTSG